MRENEGHSTAMTAFTAVQRYWPLWLGVYWRVATRAAKVRRQPLEWLLAKTLLRDERALIKLSIISFARWSVLERLPGQAMDEDQARGDDRGAGSPPRYVLFETNFNGDNDQYLEAFSLVVPLSMRLTWRLGPFGGYRVPPIVKTSRFLRYVNDVQLPISAYYCAYPEASTRIIRSALELERQVKEFEDGDYRNRDPKTFSTGYGELLEAVQKIRDPLPPEGTTGQLSVLTRVLPGRADRLKEDLARLSDALGPKLVPAQTHFARWVVADELETRSAMRPAEPPWLLFSAWFDDGSEEAYVRDLYRSMGGRAQTIWRHCGFEREDVADLDAAAKADRFWVYLDRHKVSTPTPPRGTPFQGYGGVKVERVKSALALAAKLSDFAVTSQCLSAADLQDKWKQTFEVERPEPGRERVPA
jgi:hypothetical protein